MVSGYYVVVSHPACALPSSGIVLVGPTLNPGAGGGKLSWFLGQPTFAMGCSQLVFWCNSGAAQNVKLEPLVHFGRVKVVGWESWVKPELV